jgi:hypothetical protein
VKFLGLRAQKLLPIKIIERTELLEGEAATDGTVIILVIIVAGFLYCTISMYHHPSL